MDRRTFLRRGSIAAAGGILATANGAEPKPEPIAPIDEQAPVAEKKECLRCHEIAAVKHPETKSDLENGMVLWYCPECDTIQNREGLDAAK